MEDDNLYTIKAGDNFWCLENEWDIPHGTLQKLNPKLKPRKLKIGQEIKMPTLIYLVVEEPPKRKLPNYIDKGIFEQPIDDLRIHNPIGFASGIRRVKPNNKNSQDELAIENYINGGSIGVGTIDLINIIKTRTLTSNELWHFQKNGTITYRWKKMANGASHWKNNIVNSHRIKFQNLSKSKAIGASLLKKAGPILLVADVAISREVKPSHVIDAILIGASSTGIGAIVAGAYFITDIGCEFVTGTSLSDRIDKGIDISYKF